MRDLQFVIVAEGAGLTDPVCLLFGGVPAILAELAKETVKNS
jgi:hypothetical protein